MLSENKIHNLNQNSIKNQRSVLYWMQSSHRTENNLSLNYAISKANHLNKPLLVYFGLTTSYPEANMRSLNFMLQGLQEVQQNLTETGIKFIIKKTHPPTGVLELSKNACLTIVDQGYLHHLRQWYTQAAQNIKCPLIQIEDNTIVPVSAASPKEEYSAATLRPKIEKTHTPILNQTKQPKLNNQSLDMDLETLNLHNPPSIINDPTIDSSATPTPYFHGGTNQATKHLTNFIIQKLPDYPTSRNDPTTDGLSNMSPYLHFGQISPTQIANAITNSNAPTASKDAYLEELIIRRELAINYTYYNPNYDTYQGLPNWTKKTLQIHQTDQKPYLYTTHELENAKTHDPYWNAAQTQMLKTGKMHSYMRMYWGKKILEWTKTPQEAFQTALTLNNKYELDGRDPNSYAGVAWCFGKHDRPWKERPIFGMVRYMNQNGLKRKFDADKYAQSIQTL
jgi:deoxyribodipyrimidine photo-lyase